MKKWNTPSVEELNINATANGENICLIEKEVSNRWVSYTIPGHIENGDGNQDPVDESGKTANDGLSA